MTAILLSCQALIIKGSVPSTYR